MDLSTKIYKHHMGIWVELGVFILAIAFGLWQIRDVKKAMAERKRRESGRDD